LSADGLARVAGERHLQQYPSLTQANGQVLNAKTGQPFSLKDPCIELGPQVAYNAATHQATVLAVKEFLSKSFTN
jgi:hypothetical protein